jgi:hypothetical protein
MDRHFTSDSVIELENRIVLAPKSATNHFAASQIEKDSIQKAHFVADFSTRFVAQMPLTCKFYRIRPKVSVLFT